MRLGVDSVIPIGPFEEYDPFQNYYPFGSSNRKLKSLYLDFLKVNAKDPKEILTFCERFGVLGETNAALERPLSTSSLTFSSIFPIVRLKLSPGSSYNKKQVIAAIKFYQRPGLEGHSGLKRAAIDNPSTTKGNSDTWSEERIRKFLEDMERAWDESPRNFIREISEGFGGEPRNREYKEPMALSVFQRHQLIMKETLMLLQSEQFDEEPQLRRDFIASVINCNVVVIPKLGWNASEGCWRVEFGATSLITLLWTMLMLDLSGPGRVLSCPRCGKFFLATSSKIRFCSLQCNNVYKVQQYNLRKAEKEKAVISKKKSSRTKDVRKSKKVR